MNHIEKIFVINLKHRTDRMELFTQDCIRMGIPLEKVERFDAIRMEDGCMGCSMSHLHVLSIARERGYKTFWVMEDDFTFTISREEMDQSLEYFFDSVLKKQLDWRVIMPSYNHVLVKTLPTTDSVIALTYHAQTTPSYIVNGTNQVYIDELCKCIYDGIVILSCTKMHWIGAVDQIWKKLQSDEKWYIFRKRFGEQRCGYSDISKQVIKND